MSDKVCVACNVDLPKYKQRFCSIECNTLTVSIKNNKNRKSSKNCLVCCADLLKHKRKFCSESCKKEYKKPNRTKTCKFCHIVFVANKQSQKFCKDKCRQSYWAIEQEFQRPKGFKVTHKTCAFCQNLFVTNRPTQKFCNHLCRGRNHEQKPQRKNAKKRQNTNLKSRLKTFGLTVEDYEFELQNQNYVCAICGQPETTTNMGTLRRLAVDHNHKTGWYRGLLCGKCNQGIGLFKENVAILKQAIQYLEKDGERIL